MILGQAGTSFAAVTQRNDPISFYTSPGAEPHSMNLSTGTFDHLEYLTPSTDQYQSDCYPLIETGSGPTAYAEHSQYRPDPFRYTLTHPPVGETSMSSYYVPGACAAFCDASNLQ